jgi:hypothetical protein
VIGPGQGMAQEGYGGAGSSLSRVPTELLTGTMAPGGGAPMLQMAQQQGSWW